jgi:DNA-binding transcriptional MerR regulator
MASTLDLEKRLGVTRQTISNWTKEFADMLSAGATPPKGKVRNFNDADIEIIATIAHYRSQKRSYADIRAELQQGKTIPAGDVPPMDIAERPDFAPVAMLEDFAKRLTAQYEGQIGQLENERDFLRVELTDEKAAHESERAARLEAETRAAIAETREAMLTDENENLKAEIVEKSRSWLDRLLNR